MASSLTLMQRNIEKGSVTMIRTTEIMVKRKAHSPGFSPTVAEREIETKSRVS